MARLSLAMGAILSLLLLAPSVSAGPYPAVANKPSFIAVGDGLTESAFSSENMGWGLLMQMKCTRKADIINRGFGGFYTPWFVDYMLNDMFNVANPTMAIIFLGVKDSVTQPVAGSHYISPQQFGSNVQAIMDAAKKKGVSKFLIITPPPVCEACKAQSPKPWDRENSHTALYVQQLQQLASKNGAAFLDIFTAWQKDPNWHNVFLLPDKLHLSAQGNAALFNAIIKTLESQLPAMAPSNIALNWPLMDAINKDDPGAAFRQVISSPTSKLLSKGQESAAAVNGGTTMEGQQSGAAASAAIGLSAGAGGGWVLNFALVLAVWLLLAA